MYLLMRFFQKMPFMKMPSRNFLEAEQENKTLFEHNQRYKYYTK